MKRVLLVMIASLMVACSVNQEAENQQLTDQENNLSEKQQRDDTEKVNSSAAEEMSPLSGEPVSSNNRAISVIINNHPKARPQSGLAEADIIYEVLAEGGVTRLLAIYQSQYPERVGPIRSARDYHIKLAGAYNSFFVAHGYSPDAFSMLENGVIEHINGIQYDGELFVRSSDRAAPHNSYSSSAFFEQGAKRKGVSLEGAPAGMTFSNQADLSLETAVSQFSVTYDGNETYTSEYSYEPSDDSYSRISAGEQTIDGETNEPVSIANILIMEAGHRLIDEQGRLDIDLSSGGNAYLFTKGTYFEMKWEEENGRMIPYYNGKPAPLSPGLTWIHLIPEDKGFDQLVTVFD
ncbi:DUF3048 domain-containing protein [Jeotgalibacillus campisalis]|uniref:Lipoprotein YerB n=1 Tax=Jeotgalibacillus campisalis TaxID=220754 RepID=A0A0C2RZ03_9BACL|nr:DUF3048 domain-containing protein [Jeotgalibacillus campisalis]KIL47009.1 hypothetical protein KR50_23310 [Jeotgalibacillus campisalis]